MTQEQRIAEKALKSARENLSYAHSAYKALPGSLDVVQRLAKAVQAEQAAEQDYMAAMTARLAVQINAIVPDAFMEWDS